MSTRPFADTLSRIRGGGVSHDAAEALAEIVKAVETTGKPGTLTLTLTVKKLSRSGALEVIDKITSKVPQEPAVTTLLFATPEGNLMSEDPRQSTLDLKTPSIPNASGARTLTAVGGN